MFWFGLLLVVLSVIVGAVLMHRSMNFREFIAGLYHAAVAFLKPILKRTWFWATVSIGGVIVGIWIMVKSISGG